MPCLPVQLIKINECYKTGLPTFCGVMLLVQLEALSWAISSLSYGKGFSELINSHRQLSDGGFWNNNVYKASMNFTKIKCTNHAVKNTHSGILPGGWWWTEPTEEGLHTASWCIRLTLKAGWLQQQQLFHEHSHRFLHELQGICVIAGFHFLFCFWDCGKVEFHCLTCWYRCQQKARWV